MLLLPPGNALKECAPAGNPGAFHWCRYCAVDFESLFVVSRGTKLTKHCFNHNGVAWHYALISSTTYFG